VTVDLFADVDLQAHCRAAKVDAYPGDLLPWLKQTKCNAWLYTGALENYPALVAQLAHEAPLLGSAPATLPAVRSPLQLTQALNNANLLFPETRTSCDGLPRDGSWLSKTGRGSSGSGVCLLEGSGKDASGGFFQRRVAGVPCSVTLVADGKSSKLLGVVRQLVGEPWTGAAPFQYCGCIAGYEWPAAVLEEIQKIGQVLSRTFGLLGLIGVDLVIDGDAVWVIEVNPRYTASVEVIERAHAISAIDAHIRACRDRVLPSTGMTQTTGECHGKAILFAKTQAVVSEQLERWLLEQAGGLTDYQTADIPAAGTQLAKGEPVTTLFTHGKSDAAVQQTLQQRILIAERYLLAR